MGSAKMKLQLKYGSHLPVLIKLVEMTDGDILELGMGLFSTPYLHWFCVVHKRYLASYDDQYEYYEMFADYEHEYHTVRWVSDWSKLDILKQWDVVLVDHTPAGRRKDDIVRLADYATYIIIHDTHWQGRRHYHYDEIWDKFKYRYNYIDVRPHTSVVSNIVDLRDFKI